MDVVRSIVGQGLGYSLINLPPATDRTMDGHQLITIPITTAGPDLRLGIAIVTDPTRTATSRAMATYLQKWARQINTAPR